MEGLVIRLRTLVRRVIPILRAAGWEEPDLRAISPSIRAAVVAADEPALRRWCAWLSAKLPKIEEGQGATPVLSFDAEQRLAERYWAKVRTTARVLPEPKPHGCAEPRFSTSHGPGESGNRQHTPVGKGRAWQPR